MEVLPKNVYSNFKKTQVVKIIHSAHDNHTYELNFPIEKQTFLCYTIIMLAVAEKIETERKIHAIETSELHKKNFG